jgi:acetyl/propionyl-CoA carboxylase alpha subunit
VRVDAGVAAGTAVGVEYDPLLAKLAVHAADRGAAIARARRALSEWIVLGVETNAELLLDVLASPDFRSGRYSTELIARLRRRERPTDPPDAAWLAAAAELDREAPIARETGVSAQSREAEPADPWDARTGWRPGA